MHCIAKQRKATQCSATQCSATQCSVTMTTKIRYNKFIMSKRFNSPVVIPEGIIHVKMGYSFNSSIILPKSLKIIEFGWRFNSPIELPNNLKTLYMCWEFNREIIIPPSVLFVRVGRKYTYFNGTKCTPKILDIRIYASINKAIIAPSSVEKIYLTKHTIRKVNISSSITILVSEDKIERPIRLPYGAMIE